MEIAFAPKKKEREEVKWASKDYAFINLDGFEKNFTSRIDLIGTGGFRLCCHTTRVAYSFKQNVIYNRLQIAQENYMDFGQLRGKRVSRNSCWQAQVNER